MDKIMLFYMTVGEIPTSNNLISSQVLKTASYFKNMNRFKDVCYISSIPLSSVVMSYIRRKPVSFRWLTEYPFHTYYHFSLLNLNFKFSFTFRKYLIDIEANRMIRKCNLKKHNKIIFHCRSYLAADVALIIKNKLPECDIKVLFDMRSILSSEFFYMVGRYANYIYGLAKEWERKLLCKSDLSLLPSKRGIQLLLLENPNSNLQEIKITGMDVSGQVDVDSLFMARWASKCISYIGTVSRCNTQANITELLMFLKNCIHGLNVEVISSNYYDKNISCKQVVHAEMTKYYHSILATVIPGILPHTYFESVKFSTNFFSTKASEAISCGVPLIVNEAISELAQFVEENECGILFNFNETGKVVFKEKYDFNNFEFWRHLTKNMFKISSRYSFLEVVGQYDKYYETLASQSEIHVYE